MKGPVNANAEVSHHRRKNTATQEASGCCNCLYCHNTFISSLLRVGEGSCVCESVVKPINLEQTKGNFDH